MYSFNIFLLNSSIKGDLGGGEAGGLMYL